MDIEPRIVHVDWLPDGVVIEFDDGETAVYTAVMLRANLSEAKDVESLPDIAG